MVELDRPQIINHITESLQFTAHDVKWIPRTPRFAIVGETTRGAGIIRIYELEKGNVRKVHETEKTHPIKCGTLGASSMHRQHFATGGFDGFMNVWDLERTDVPLYKVKAHEQIINAIDGCGGTSLTCGPPEIATGGRDGNVCVWDVRQKDAPVAQITPKAHEKTRECWTVGFGNSFNNDERWIAAGYDNGDVKIFDLRTMGLVWETNLSNGICNVQFDRWDIKANKLVATTLESSFHVFDLRTLHKEKGFADLRNKEAGNHTTWVVRHMPQNRDIFATTSGNGVISLHKYHYPKSRTALDDNKRPYGVMGTVELLNRATVGDQPVASFDWSPDKQGLCAYTCYDQSVRVGIVTRLSQY